MEEYASLRSVEVASDNVKVSFENANVSWGFKVKEENQTDSKLKNKVKGNISRKREIDLIDQCVIHGLHFTMNKGDFLTIVGKVGCGKTSLLYSVM